MQKPISKTSAWITQHSSLSLILASFIFSWILWLIPFVLQISDAVASRHLNSIGAFGPALAAVLITRMGFGPSEQTLTKRLENWGMCFVAVGSLYFICLPYASSLPLQTSILGWVVRIMLLIAAAFVINAAFSNRSELACLIIPTPGASNNPIWYVIAIIAFPILLLVGLGLSILSGSPFELSLQSRDALFLFLQIVTTFFYILVFGGALAQEPAWRGLLLTDWQKRFNPLLATFLIGIISAVWMLPLYLNGFYATSPNGLTTDLLNHLLTTLLIAFPLTWLYNRTRGNLLVCILFQASFYTASAFIAATSFTLAVLVLLAFVLIIADRMWQRLPASAQTD